MVTPLVIRVTTPYSWSMPIIRGAPPGVWRAAACRPSVSSRTCFGFSTLVVGFVAPVGSCAVKLTRIRPPRWNLAIISAGVFTPASPWLPAAEVLSTFVAELPYAYGMST
jgi:hypothetical protein